LSDRAINDLASPKDTIFARKIVMGAIDMNMDEIETMLAPGGEAQSRRRAGTCRHDLDYADGDPAHVSGEHKSMGAERRARSRDGHLCGSGAVDQFRRFLSASGEASKIASEAARAKGAEDFRARISELRAACNSCHAVYQKTD
jgi:hypothetical protein